MRFTIAAATSLIAAASAVAVPRSGYGSWTVSFAKNSAANGFYKEDVTAVYTNPELAENITTTCVYQNADTHLGKKGKTCDPNTFDYTLEYTGPGLWSKFIFVWKS